MATYAFKTSAESLAAIDSGKMNFLPTAYAHPYQAGDIVVLSPHDRLGQRPDETRALISREIEFVLAGTGLGFHCGIRKGYCILGLK